MSHRVVFTVATGSPHYVDMALGLARSLSLVGDLTSRVLMTDQDVPGLSRWFEHVIPPPPGVPPYLRKLEALSGVDAKRVLFLDSDCLALHRLDRVWELCEGAPIAVQGRPVSSGHWYGELADVLPRVGLDRLFRFNGGLIYYEQGPEFEQLRGEVRRVAENYAATGLEAFRDQVPDEPCVSIAMVRTGLGTLIPDEADLMNTPVGLVGKLRLDVMRGECSFVKRGRDLRLIRPVVFHAGRYVSNLAYWRQLDTLRWLQEYEDRHPPGYMSPWHKLRRSLERRWLRHVKGIPV